MKWMHPSQYLNLDFGSLKCLFSLKFVDQYLQEIKEEVVTMWLLIIEYKYIQEKLQK